MMWLLADCKGPISLRNLESYDQTKYLDEDTTFIWNIMPYGPLRLGMIITKLNLTKYCVLFVLLVFQTLPLSAAGWTKSGCSHKQQWLESATQS